MLKEVFVSKKGRAPACRAVDELGMPWNLEPLRTVLALEVHENTPPKLLMLLLCVHLLLYLLLDLLLH